MDKNELNRVVAQGLGPAAAEFGSKSGEVGKNLAIAATNVSESLVIMSQTVKILLKPLELMVWSYSKLEETFIPMVARKLQDIPQERLEPPPLSIAGPVMEAARFAVYDSELCEIFATLLASAMDSAAKDGVHPSFVEIVKQITSDEAKILRFLAKNGAQPVVELRNSESSTSHFKIIERNYSFIGLDADVSLPNNTPAYIDNLCRLMVTEIPSGNFLTQPQIYDRLEKDLTVAALAKNLKSVDRELRFDRKALRTTDFGNKFYKACLGVA